jgi:UDP-N-acetylmuramyl pentapeptide phosphotransferase/UDP-N-acetylglucosamine-1-phosphate transferase
MKGHLAALAKNRRVTTGLAKAVGGAAVGIWAAYVWGATGWAVLPAGALVAVSANTINVLDARPGRAVKGFVLASVIVLALSCRAPLPGAVGVLAALLGAAIVFAWADLGERVMLGDTGANPLGCVLGMGVLGLTSWPVWLALSVALALICVAADRWSLSRLIDAAPVLRWIDELGRPGRAAGRGSHGD